MAVDAAIDDEAGGDDGGIASAPGKELRLQRDLEAAGYREEIDTVVTDSELADLGDEGDPALVDDVLVPTGLDEGDAYCGVLVALIHGGSSQS